MRISDWSSDVCSSDLADSERPWRGAGAGVSRCDAGVEAGCRAAAGRAGRAYRPRRPQGGEVEFAALRRPGCPAGPLVPQLPLLRPLCEGYLLPRLLAAPDPARDRKSVV